MVKSERKELEPMKMDCTVRLLHSVKGIGFKKRAPRAIRQLKQQATKLMGTRDVRLDTKLNEMIWKKGIRYLPSRMRVRFNRKRNEDVDAAESFYTVIEYVECANFKGLLTEVVSDSGVPDLEAVEDN